MIQKQLCSSKINKKNCTIGQRFSFVSERVIYWKERIWKMQQEKRTAVDVSKNHGWEFGKKNLHNH